jgi:cytidylate kinase
VFAKSLSAGGSPVLVLTGPPGVGKSTTAEVLASRSPSAVLIPGWFLEPLADALRDAGHTVACAVLRAPASTCVARVQSREGVPLEAGHVEQLCRSFADLGRYERNAIELEGEEPGEVADIVSRRLAGGLLAI